MSDNFKLLVRISTKNSYVKFENAHVFVSEVWERMDRRL